VTEAQEPVLDGEALDRLHGIGGDEFVMEMIGLFLEHAPGRITAIKAGYRAGQLAAVERAAHSLKSTAAGLGARALAATAEAIEQQAKDGAAAAVPPLLGELTGNYDQVRARLETERDRRSRERGHTMEHDQ
jgi:HPt (histidine-containing phosphotransfer) domain-containing protein